MTPLCAPFCHARDRHRRCATYVRLGPVGAHTDVLSQAGLFLPQRPQIQPIRTLVSAGRTAQKYPHAICMKRPTRQLSQVMLRRSTHTPHKQDGHVRRSTHTSAQKCPQRCADLPTKLRRSTHTMRPSAVALTCCSPPPRDRCIQVSSRTIGV